MQRFSKHYNHVAHLTVPEKLIPLSLREWLAAKVFPVDSIDPHVVVIGVNHKVKHAKIVKSVVV